MVRLATHAEHNTTNGRNVKDVILGANDALVSTIALVAGVSAAAVSSRIVIVAAVAELVAGAISMGVSNYLSAKSQQDLYRRELDREKREIHEVPEEERAEVREIYRQKGFAGKELETVVDVITSDRQRWLEVMMEEELGFPPSMKDGADASSLRVAGAFAGFGLIPVIPYLFLPTQRALGLAIGLTALALVVIGGWKSRFSHRPVARNIGEMILLAGFASLVSYALGAIISEI